MTECELPTQCPMEEKIDRLLVMQEAFAGAFHKDEYGQVDFVGHKRYHEAAISAARAQEEFWRGLRYDLTKRGIIWGIITILGLASLGLAWKLATFMHRISPIVGK